MSCWQYDAPAVIPLHVLHPLDTPNCSSRSAPLLIEIGPWKRALLLECATRAVYRGKLAQCRLRSTGYIQKACNVIWPTLGKDSRLAGAFAVSRHISPEPNCSLAQTSHIGPERTLERHEGGIAGLINSRPLRCATCIVTFKMTAAIYAPLEQSGRGKAAGLWVLVYMSGSKGSESPARDQYVKVQYCGVGMSDGGYRIGRFVAPDTAPVQGLGTVNNKLTAVHSMEPTRTCSQSFTMNGLLILAIVCAHLGFGKLLP